MDRLKNDRQNLAVIILRFRGPGSHWHRSGKFYPACCQRGSKQFFEPKAEPIVSMQIGSAMNGSYLLTVSLKRRLGH
jgi:hypothetical protein